MLTFQSFFEGEEGGRKLVEHSLRKPEVQIQISLTH